MSFSQNRKRKRPNYKRSILLIIILLLVIYFWLNADGIADYFFNVRD